MTEIRNFVDNKVLSWKEAARVFFYSRLLVFGVTCACILLLPLWIPGFITWINPHDRVLSEEPLNQLILSWLRWDAKAYLNIAYHGYSHTPDTAFFPLWPLLQHLGGVALGGSFPLSFYLAGLLLANLCFFLDLVLLHQLLAKHYGLPVARRTLFYFTFSPFAIFFFAGYSEALFMLLCLAAFLAWQRGQALDWWLAGLCCLLAALTRSAGVILGVPFLVAYIRRFWWRPRIIESTWKQKLNALLPLALIPLGPIMYMIYLFYTKGDPFIFQAQEDLIWHRELTFPLTTIVLGVQAVFQVPELLLKVTNLLDLLPELVFVVALCKGWKALPLHYTLFALCIAVGALCWPLYSPFSPLASQPRYLIILFPVALIFALWGKDRHLDLGLRAGTVVLFAISAGVFISNVWLA